MSKHYDLIALGGGSGGMAAARRAAAYGAKCAVIEMDRLGGTCVNRGCVPKKLMWHAAEFVDAVAMANEYGFDGQLWSLDWRRLVNKREQYLRKLNDIYNRNLLKGNIEFISGRASFSAAKTLIINEQEYTADHIVIATGGEPLVPDIPGASYGINSDGFFELTNCPDQVAIIGSGYIAVELAGMLTAFGSQVSLLARGGQWLRAFDSMLGEALSEQMKDQGIQLYTDKQVCSLSKDSSGISIVCADGEIASKFDTLIWAIGRKPLTEQLNLGIAGISVDAQGFVPTDEYENTRVNGIYAVGDVTGKAQLTPVAIAAARRLADRLFGGMTERKLDYENIPSVIFSHPPIGSVGLSEEQARQRYPDQPIKVYQTRFNALYYALSDHKVPTTMKLVTLGDEQKVVGCHVIGMGADEMLQGFAVAIRLGACKQDFDDTVAIHPTSAEELVTMI